MSSVRLKKELEQRKMSVRQLALKSGIIPQALYAAINGKVEFWPGWKKKVADALELSVEDLFEE